MRERKDRAERWGRGSWDFGDAGVAANRKIEIGENYPKCLKMADFGFWRRWDFAEATRKRSHALPYRSVSIGQLSRFADGFHCGAGEKRSEWEKSRATGLRLAQFRPGPIRRRISGEVDSTAVFMGRPHDERQPRIEAMNPGWACAES